MRKPYYSIVCILLWVFVGYAQSDFVISGTVSDPKGKPLAYTMVFILNHSIGTQTDARGHYALRVPTGSYELKVSAVGYKSGQRKVKVSSPLNIDFILHPISYDLGEVKVEGKSQAQIVQNKAYTAAMLDVQSVTSSLNSLGTLIGRIGGIRIRETGGLGSDFNLSINGLSGNAIRYFVDGVPLSTLGSGVDIANLPVNLVDRIEIYKGVVPADLGEDALGGAVNIITKRNRGNYLDASIGGGSFHTAKADISAQYTHSPSGFTIRPSLGINYSKNDYIMRDVEVWNASEHRYEPQDRRRFHDAFRSLFGQVEMGFANRKWADEAFISVAGTTSDKEIQTGVKQTIVIGEATRNVRSLNVSARYVKHHLFFENLSARFFLSYTADHRQLTDTAFRAYSWDQTWMKSPRSEVTRRDKSIRHYLRPQVTFRSNLNYFLNDRQSLNLNYLLTSTGNRRYDDFDDQFVPTDDRMDKHIIGLTYNHSFFDDRLSTSFFMKDYIFHTELKQKDLYWITGIDEIDPSATRNNMGCGAGARYTITPAIALKASYERGVRLPVTREFLGNGETINPNFRLRPEIAHNINLGGFGEVSRGEHRVMYEAHLFGRKVQDYILRLSDGDQSYYDNISSATVLGAEAELSYEYGKSLRTSLNATYLEERNKTYAGPSGKYDITYNNRMPNRPWMYANAQLSWNHRTPFGLKDSRLTIDYNYRYIQWFYLTWEAYGSKEGKKIIPSQHAHDIATTWYFDHDKYSLSLECTNIFDRKLYDNYMLQKPGRAFFGKFRIFLY